jgi:polysaccharide export outer membrane protein
VELRPLSALAASLLALSGCSLWAPGITMRESGVKDRAGKASPAEPGVVEVTPEVVGRLQAELRGATAGGAPRVDPLAAEAAVYEYRIAPFDIIGVTVWDHPELTIPAGEFRTPESTGNPVRADGTMFYPHAGVMKVAGKTVSDVRELLTERLTRVITRPQLDVRVVQFRGKKVQVTGEVLAPSTLPITDVPMRVQDALAQSKGIGPEADLSRVTLTRAGRVHELDLQALYERGDASQNWLLTDGDVVNVPDRSRNKVFVMGEVKLPASKLMVKGRMTLAEAIGDSAGIDQTAASGILYVIRGDYQKPTVYRLDATSADALLLAVQFPLRPADVVFVSTSELTRWSRVTGQVLPTIQGLWQMYDVAYRTKLVPQ